MNDGPAATPPERSEDYLPLVRHIVNHFLRGRRFAERDDLEQEVMVRLVALWPGYDPARARRAAWVAGVTRWTVRAVVRDGTAGRSIIRFPRGRPGLVAVVSLDGIASRLDSPSSCALFAAPPEPPTRGDFLDAVRHHVGFTTDLELAMIVGVFHDGVFKEDAAAAAGLDPNTAGRMLDRVLDRARCRHDAPRPPADRRFHSRPRPNARDRAKAQEQS